MKRCTKCNALKDESEYYFNDKSKKRRHSFCKVCQSLYYAERYKKRAGVRSFYRYKKRWSDAYQKLSGPTECFSDFRERMKDELMKKCLRCKMSFWKDEFIGRICKYCIEEDKK